MELDIGVWTMNRMFIVQIVDVREPFGNRFSFSDAKARLLKFDETDVDLYLTDFEKVCTAYHFSHDE